MVRRQGFGGEGRVRRRHRLRRLQRHQLFRDARSRRISHRTYQAGESCGVTLGKYGKALQEIDLDLENKNFVSPKIDLLMNGNRFAGNWLSLGIKWFSLDMSLGDLLYVL